MLAPVSQRSDGSGPRPIVPCSRAYARSHGRSTILPLVWPCSSSLNASRTSVYGKVAAIGTSNSPAAISRASSARTAAFKAV